MVFLSFHLNSSSCEIHEKIDKKFTGNCSCEFHMKIFTCIIILCNSSVCPYSSNDVFPHIGSFDRNRVVVSLRNTWLYPIYYAGGSSQEQTSNLKECVDHNVFSSWLDHPFPDSNYLVQPSVVRLVKGDKKPFMSLISPGYYCSLCPIVYFYQRCSLNCTLFGSCAWSVPFTRSSLPV